LGENTPDLTSHSKQGGCALYRICTEEVLAS